MEDALEDVVEDAVAVARILGCPSTRVGATVRLCG